MTFLLFTIVGILCINNSNALPTYVGVQIKNMTDDPASSCANRDTEGDYGFQGRIRALSSILPHHPIHFELTYQANGSSVWTGDSTKDTDYTIGDVIFMPNSVELQTGVNYNLMFDIDAIRIYLPLPNYYVFTETINDEYWTAGKYGNAYSEYYAYSHTSNLCKYNGASSTSYTLLVSNKRQNLVHSCMSDNAHYNCDDFGFLGVSRSPTNDYRIDAKYDNLYQDGVGNFNLIFTAP